MKLTKLTQPTEPVVINPDHDQTTYILDTRFGPITLTLPRAGKVARIVDILLEAPADTLESPESRSEAWTGIGTPPGLDLE